ncbi:MAG: hypothetical protein WBR15_04285 [Gammaproteobacteria bacterium]
MNGLAEIIRSGIELSVRGDKLHVKAPDHASLSAVLLDRLRAEKPRLLPLLRACEEACRGLTAYVTASELLVKLCAEDLQKLEASTDQLRFLRSFAIAVVWTDFRREGIAPPTWDQPAHCDLCGDVLLWASIAVAGCPWCWNRLHNVKIPRLISSVRVPGNLLPHAAATAAGAVPASPPGGVSQ